MHIILYIICASIPLAWFNPEYVYVPIILKQFEGMSLQRIYYVVVILSALPLLIERIGNVLSKWSCCKKNVEENEPTKEKLYSLFNEKCEEEDNIVGKLQATYPDTKFYTIICKELNDNIMRRFTQFFESLQPTDNHLYVMIHISDGGDSAHCTIITRMFLNYLKQCSNNKITVCVPQIACSSGAQIAISGSELVMGRFAHLTPFDDQLCGIGVKNIKRILKDPRFKPIRFSSLKDYDLAYRATFNEKLTKTEITDTLVHLKYPKTTIKQVIKMFVSHKLYHSYPYDISAVKSTGLNVSELNDSTISKTFDDLYDMWMDDELNK